MTTPLLINNAATLLLPPQTLNTHQKTSHRSHTTAKSTNTLSPTHHHTLQIKFQNLSSLNTQNLMTYNSIKNSTTPTTQTNWHHLTNQSSLNTSWHHSPHTYHSKISTPTKTSPLTLITHSIICYILTNTSSPSYHITKKSYHPTYKTHQNITYPSQTQI